MDIIEQDELMKKEIESGLYPDPSTIDPATGLPLDAAPAAGGTPDPTAPANLGKPQVEPSPDEGATEAPQIPKGGEI